MSANKLSLQQRIIAELAVQSEIDAASEIRRRVDFLANYLLQSAASGYVLGISGGQDSTLAGRLAQLAVEQVRSQQQSDQSQFYAVRLPYGTQFDEADAQAALDFIRPDMRLQVNIKNSVEQMEQSVNEAYQGARLDAEVSDFNRGNVKARARMIAQYAIAGDLGLLVIGTDHAAEAVTGFFTKHGDGAADVMPLNGLTKSQGAKLLQELGAPAALWQKQPTADLLDDAPGQLDEDSLGVRYADIDAYLTGHTVSEQAQQIIEKKFLQSRHKRNFAANPDNDWWLK